MRNNFKEKSKNKINTFAEISAWRDTDELPKDANGDITWGMYEKLLSGELERDFEAAMEASAKRNKASLENSPK